MEKTIIKFGDIEIQKQKLQQNKVTTLIKNIDIDKIVVSNKVSFGKRRDLNISLATKMLAKLDPYAYFSQKWVHIEKTLMKLNIYLSSQKMINYQKKYSEIWEKVKNSFRKEFHGKQVYNNNYLKAKTKSK